MTEEEHSHPEEDQQRKSEIFLVATAFPWFTSKFPPASSFSDARRFMTTGEITALLKKIFPAGTFTSSDVFDLLQDNNYRWDVDANDIPVWLIKTEF